MMDIGRAWRLIRPLPLLVFVVTVCASTAGADYDAGKRAWGEGKPAEAMAQWRAAADAGDRRAMLELGRLYRMGLGAPQDYVLAHMWFNLAASRGEAAAVKERDALAAKMTPQQVAAAQERVRTWRPGDGSAGRPGTVATGRRSAPPPPRAIREAQELLAALGYEPGPADGLWGARSARAYAAFLHDAGLPLGDALTPEGLRAIRAAAKPESAGPETSSAASTKTRKPAAPRPDALHRAVVAGDIDGVKAALKAGVDVNARDGRGWTALMHVANKGYTLMLEPLLEAKADVDARAADGATALFIAALHEHSEVIELLMKAGADPTIQGPKNKTAEGLMGAKIAREKYGGPSALHKALRANEGPAIIRALLDMGADINARDIERVGNSQVSYTPLNTAAIHNTHPEIIALLLDRGANLHEQTKYQFKWSDRPEPEPSKNSGTPLHWASANKNPEIAKLLLKRGAQVNARDTDGETPLHRGSHNPEFVKVLLENGADVHAWFEGASRHKPRWWALHKAVYGKLEVVKLLLDWGADVNAGNSYTALHVAAEYGTPEIVELLLDRGADVSLRDYRGRTALQRAERNRALTGTDVYRRLERETGW